jgi:hypothetical protein
MFKKYPLFFLLLVQVWAQSPANIQYEILSGSLTAGEEPYTIQVALQVQSSQEIGFIQLAFDSLKAQMHITAAELNSESLWLLRSEEKPEKDKVLTWMYDNKDAQLKIYPNTWPAPYRLVVDIQIALMQDEAVSDVLRASAQINNNLLPCQPAGRGNTFSVTQ